jgi:hypothetical protein
MVARSLGKAGDALQRRPVEAGEVCGATTRRSLVPPFADGGPFVLAGEGDADDTSSFMHAHQ